MSGAVWDIDTDADPPALVHPLVYVTGSEAVRVRVWMKLATPLGGNALDTKDGLDHRRLMQPDTSDAERSAMVREAVLDVEGVAEITGEPDVSVDFDVEPGPRLSIKVEARTIYDDPIAVTL